MIVALIWVSMLKRGAKITEPVPAARSRAATSLCGTPMPSAASRSGTIHEPQSFPNSASTWANAGENRRFEYRLLHERRAAWGSISRRDVAEAMIAYCGEVEVSSGTPR